MNAKIGQHMTLLGICAMAFYGAMLASGKLSIDVMPQFVVSAAIFLTSGRIMRRAARMMARDNEEEQEEEEKTRKSKPIEADWPFLTQLLNWTAALLVVGVMAIFLMKPIGLSWSESFSSADISDDHFFSKHIP
ncbi:MAG: hypothetical protein AB7F20_14290 [Geoalkalibacter sp.]|jgi:hypothetical protein|uniref:hypothetical protein n=1 Tax=Geoalkalibacter sp. TaxID=3041440 RepID=UPI002A942077|nr:hypothetical protein [Thermodesulfobacteriota bacterium]